MAVHIRYENDNHLVVWVFEGKWTWDEYYQHRSEVNARIAQTEGRVDMIIDMTKGDLLPQNLMTHAGQAALKSPSNMGKIIFVGSNRILHAFFNVFRRLYSATQSDKETDLIMVRTIDEAYTILGESLHRVQQ